MYSPKIREDLIPRIYQAAKEGKLPMTAWVNQAVEQALPAAATQPEHTDTQRKDSDSYECNRDRTQRQFNRDRNLYHRQN
jgi:hypothetical protein